MKMRGAGAADLFDIALARRDDPETSHEAAAKVDVSKREAEVYAALRAVWPAGLTTHEIEDATGIAAGSVTPRMKRLVEKGWVERTEERRIPRGHTSPQTIWRAIVDADIHLPTATGTSHAGSHQPRTEQQADQRRHGRPQIPHG